MHFASFSTDPSDTNKSVTAFHLSRTEQFWARRVVGTTLGFLWLLPRASPWVFSSKYGLRAWSLWYLKASRPPRYWITKECAADYGAFHIQISSFSTTTNSHYALSAMRSTEIVSNFQSHFPCGPTQGKSASLLPAGERRSAGGTFPSRALLLGTFHSSEVPSAKEKGVWPGCPGAPHGHSQGLRQLLEMRSFLFFPSSSDFIELFVPSLHTLSGWCICIYSSHCVWGCVVLGFFFC